MNNTLEILQRIFGLTATEAKLYLAGLDQSTTNVQNLAHTTRVKRTTVYHALNTLLSKGLAAKSNNGRQGLFTMTKPEYLQAIITERKKQITAQENEVAELIALLPRSAKKSSQPRITHYEGIEGVKVVYEEALYCKARHWDIISPHTQFLSDYGKNFIDYVREQRRSRKITARALWEGMENREMLTKEELRDRQPRLLPKIMHGRFTSIMILFDNKIALILPFKQAAAVLIESNDLFATMQAIFDGLWENARPLLK